MVQYTIWHDNDFDFALWVYNNSCLKGFENVIIRSIPKSNSESLIKEKFHTKEDYYLMCAIKYATPDLVIQKTDDKWTKILFCSEFMTQTPQHDHVFQRFERIFCISKLKIPVAFVFAERKCKLEKDKKQNKYTERFYSPNPLAVHTYLKTSKINNSPTLMFFWPDLNWYLKYDIKHQTAPKIEWDIIKWFDFLNLSVKNENNNLIDENVVKNQIKHLNESYLLKTWDKFLDVNYDDFLKKYSDFYNLSRISIINTNDVISKYNLNKTMLNQDFLKNSKTLIFEYESQKVRTTPYCWFICWLYNLFCLDDEWNKKINLIHKPIYKTYRWEFVWKTEDITSCPFENFLNFNNSSLQEILDHDCIYYKSQFNRIFSNIPDLNIIWDQIFYN